MASLIGIDLGTTGCKAVVYDERGIALGESYLEYGLITLSATMVEQDPHAWWDLTLQAVNAALDAAAADRSAVVGIAVSSQGISFVLLDEDDRPLGNAINWLDGRATAECDDILARYRAETLFALTGKRAAPFYVLPKLLWLRRHEPEKWQAARAAPDGARLPGVPVVRRGTSPITRWPAARCSTIWPGWIGTQICWMCSTSRGGSCRRCVGQARRSVRCSRTWRMRWGCAARSLSRSAARIRSAPRWAPGSTMAPPRYRWAPLRPSSSSWPALPPTRPCGSPPSHSCSRRAGCWKGSSARPRSACAGSATCSAPTATPVWMPPPRWFRSGVTGCASTRTYPAPAARTGTWHARGSFHGLNLATSRGHLVRAVMERGSRSRSARISK